ncbi:MAG: cyclic nucleotide-binding domain-containing protein [Anaerolineales bacterium]
MTDIVRSLERSLLFGNQPKETLALIGQQFRVRTLSSGEILFRKGEQGDALFIVAEGRLQIVTQNAQGDEVILNECGVGETIGEMSLVDESPRSATVIALEPTVMLELKREDFLQLLDEQPKIALLLLLTLISRLRFATTYIEKATEWSRKVSQGDYAFIEESVPLRGAEEKAQQFLGAFFQMVRDVQQREQALRQQIQALQIEVDEVRRRQAVEELTATEFYHTLRQQAQELRRHRHSGKRKGE